MAKQNKGRKFFAASATAALVASAIVPVASAAQVNDYNKISGYAKEAVQSLVDAGVIQGDTNGNFNPLNTVTRAQAAEIFTKALELEADGDVNFSDVKKGAWYYNSIAAVVANGIFEGVSAKEFAPNKSLTRSEAAKVLVDAFGLEGSESLSQFADASQVKPWAKSALETAVANGIFTGSEENGKLNLKPNAAITRQDFAVVFARTLDSVDTETPVDASVKAINNTTVEVTFDEEVDNVEALKFKIEGLEVKNAAVKQTNKKVVVLTTASQTADKEYVVTLDGEEIGKFKGIEAVVPKSIVLKTTNTQGKVGDQVTLTADVGVKAEGIPVTFNIDAPSGSLNKDAVVEVYTNAEGIASYSYTQYSPEADDVTVYPTGAPQLRAFGTVYWGVDNILKLEEVTTGNVLANGVKKTYKVTFKDPKTGVALAGRDLNISFVENTDVAFSAISKATVTNPVSGLTVTPYQTTTGLAQGISVKTDSNGQATFIVSGTNTAVTPYVFVDGSSSVWYSQNNVTGTQNVQSNTNLNNKWEARELTTTAPLVKFEGAQLNHQITVERNGEEEAAANKTNPTTRTNGREYTLTVKDKDGKAYAGGVVNVSFDELVDRNISTNTTAQLANVENSTALYGLDAAKQKGFVKLDSNGKAKVLVYGADDVAATPIVWIDQNTSQNYQTGVLEEGEPSAKGAVSNFQYERVIGGKLTTADASTGTATYKFSLTNQSGKELDNLKGKLSYEIRNTGANDVYVTLPIAYYTQDNVLVPAGTEHRVAVGGHVVLSAQVTEKANASFKVTSKALAASVAVVPTFVTENNFDASNDNGALTDARDFNKSVTTAAVTTSFGEAGAIGNPHTGLLNLASINETNKTLRFQGSLTDVKYAGEDKVTYKYYGIGKTTIADADQFIAELKSSPQDVRLTRTVVENSDGSKDVTFEIVSTGHVSNGTAGKIVSAVVSDETADALGLVDTISFTFDKDVNASTLAIGDFIFSGGYAIAPGTTPTVSGKTVKYTLTAAPVVAGPVTVSTLADTIGFTDGKGNIAQSLATAVNVTVGSKISKSFTVAANQVVSAGVNATGKTTVGTNEITATVLNNVNNGAVPPVNNVDQYNGISVTFAQSIVPGYSGAPTAIYNAGTKVITVSLGYDDTQNTLANIQTAINNLANPAGIDFDNIVLSESAAPAAGLKFNDLATSQTLSLANGKAAVGAQAGVYTFAIYPTLATGDKVTVNGVTYTKVVLGSAVAADKTFDTAATLAAAIVANDSARFAPATAGNPVTGVVTLVDATVNGAAAPSVSVQ
ncbi:S-layer homology domain-containing protein [Lysinibacillus capsici]|uniref:S-layer homology domain-containing protein n=1 Tax=Lysinibacillus capsici TaxID=2115968 RepID=UPI0030815330|nr:S-layer homology domain-containing protein [Lysinibacillus capsici]